MFDSGIIGWIPYGSASGNEEARARIAAIKSARKANPNIIAASTDVTKRKYEMNVIKRDWDRVWDRVVRRRGNVSMADSVEGFLRRAFLFNKREQCFSFNLMKRLETEKSTRRMFFVSAQSK